MVLVAGPNGAGKTTLLRLLAGLLPLSAGTAIVLGHDLAADRRTVRTELALVGHAPGAYDDLTVRENVRFWVRAGGGRVSDADAVLEQLGLARLAGVSFGRLSAGQQRRTGLAVALARRPGSSCSTNPTPASTPPAATCSTTCCGAAPRMAGRCSWSPTNSTAPGPSLTVK